MPSTSQKFNFLGLLVKPEAQNDWLVSHTGASCIKSLGDNRFELIISGRDSSNRSTLGTAHLTLHYDEYKLEIISAPILSHGQIGTFDENGVSYPYLVTKDNTDYLYYTGWMLTVLTPFQNQLGLAVRKQGEQKFSRFSRAPIMERNNDDFTSIGSSAVIYHDGLWRMWYTGFGEWSEHSSKASHTYCIKYAFSNDGIKWERNNIVCIPSSEENPNIARPTVVFDKSLNLYRMWFCYRKEEYKIGYATSKDGIEWKRSDEISGFSPSGQDWDKQSQCYPFAFYHKDSLYLIYAGNNYGKGGLGICRQASS